MKSFKFYNNISGWVVFAIAAITYLLTIEPSASFWDCGEFITSSNTLEVGHPPGAPFFMILGRFFALFAFGDVTHVARMINVMSALMSAFTILFLFWSISHIAKKIISSDNKLSIGQYMAILGSAAIGALVYTFSDTFWFSAVEGEVYATSSFFTAIVFWAILKWENEADQKYANRWIIFIAYLMGLSIGVHLLNLLAIPAIVFVYYFKKYEVSRNGVIIAFFTSIILLAVVMYGVIQGVVVFGSAFERFFTNSLSLGYGTGFTLYLLLIIGGLVYGIYYTLKNNKAVMNTILTSVLVILIGYSSFALILIRSQADTPMNQNSPDNIFSLISYLNREQYGDRPLVYGQYFNAPLVNEEPYLKVKPIYEKENGKYVVVDHKLARNYVSEYKTLFPRMYSDQDSPNHIKGYEAWTGTSDKDFYYPKVDEKTNQTKRDRYGDIIYDKYSPKRVPTFGENLEFFFKYQLNFMYFRYFMWNFAGRQSDVQGNGSVKDGNWISGIKFIDEIRLGNQDKITPEMKNNKARNVYYFLPLILGILGIIYLLTENRESKNYFWVVMLFFFFTGVAIVLYLNQPPYQPRERDYAYAGSFYAFSIFIGMGVFYLYNLFKKYSKETVAATLAIVLSVISPVIMANQNWDDHDRSYRNTARDYAKNYLSSCKKNAIIFTNGDNDTFPLWYIQEVEGFRTDVRVINLSYFNTNWYINQMRKKAYLSEPVKFSMTPDKYGQGKRDMVYVIPNENIYLNEKYKASLYKFQTIYEAIYNEFMDYIATTNFSEKFSDEYVQLKKGYTSISPVDFYRFIKQLTDSDLIKKSGLNIDEEIVKMQLQKAQDLLKSIASAPLPLDIAINHVASDEDDYKAPIQGDKVNYFPSSKFIIPANKDTVIKYNVVDKTDISKSSPNIIWDIGQSYLTKNHILVLDMIATNNWERPIYFATTTGGSQYLNLENYFQLEGLAYRLVPVKSSSKDYLNQGRVNSDILYENVMNKFVWGGVDTHKDKIYLDENNRRFILNFKSTFRALATQLVNEKKFDKAEKVLDKCVSLFPNDFSSFGYYDILISELYFKMKKDEKGMGVMKIAAQNFKDDLSYYISLDDNDKSGLGEDIERTAALYMEVTNILTKYGQKDFVAEYAKEGYDIVENAYNFSQILGNLKSEQEQQNWYQSIPSYKRSLINLEFTLENFIKKE